MVKNAKTADGTVHALRQVTEDEHGMRVVACGLRGQTHSYADERLKKVAAEWTDEEVTCMACIAVMDADDDNEGPPSNVRPLSWGKK